MVGEGVCGRVALEVGKGQSGGLVSGISYEFLHLYFV